MLGAALAIADADGLERLTVRTLAARLGVTPMAIYWHFDNKAAMVAELVDFVVHQYDVFPGESGTLRARLQKTFRTMYQGLDEHPGILGLLPQPENRGRASLAVMQALLDQLKEAGQTRAESQASYHLLMSFTMGAVAMSHAVGAARGGRRLFEANLERVIDTVLAPALRP